LLAISPEHSLAWVQAKLLELVIQIFPPIHGLPKQKQANPSFYKGLIRVLYFRIPGSLKTQF
jgi:hypothetical protein